MAGAKNNYNMGMVVACLVALMQISLSAASTSHTVGDTSGWIMPVSDSSLYTTWASKNTINVGDVLVFNFATGSHTVAEVSKSDYDSCSGSNPISSHTSGPASITVSTAGAHYYICTFNGHCSSGQKLAITATAASSSTPTTPTATSPSDGPSSTTTTTTPPPPTSSAGSLAAAGFVLPLVAAVFML